MAEALVANDLADMRIILLLDVSLVVFPMGTRAGLADVSVNEKFLAEVRQIRLCNNNSTLRIEYA